MLDGVSYLAFSALSAILASETMHVHIQSVFLPETCLTQVVSWVCWLIACKDQDEWCQGLLHRPQGIHNDWALLVGLCVWEVCSAFSH